jgi:phenylalanyl-tRNA synthetase alpha subunit
MQTGAILHETGQHIRLLLEEAREIEHKIQVAKKEADTDEIDENNALEMMELQIRREEIKREVEILENPLMRWVNTLFLHFKVNLISQSVIVHKLWNRIFAT